MAVLQPFLRSAAMGIATGTSGTGSAVLWSGCARPIQGSGADAAHPIREARDETQILDDMLLADQADRNLATRRDGDCRTKEALGHEDALERGA